jgi:hypothetical protein
VEKPPSTLSQLLPLVPIALAVLGFGYFVWRRARRVPSFDFGEPGVRPAAVASAGEIRKRGLKKMAVGGVTFVAILILITWLSTLGYPFHFALVPACFPFVFVCVGLIEAVTGAPYSGLAKRWMTLRGWQRAVIGTSIVLTALVVILLGVTFVVMLFT